jgi:hypothetical protein
MDKHKYKISVLLPTRGRTDALSRSVMSLINRATKLDQIQLIIALDDDDQIGLTHFTEVIQPWLDEKNVAYTAMSFTSMGYDGLNRYYNEMAKNSDADWFFVWNDDAIMETAGWDKIIIDRTGDFKLLAVRTHNDHPYSIFPIVPSQWYDLFNRLSLHQMIDAELSQLAYMLDLFERVDIFVTHDRADLTGNNKDETDKNRTRFEGNPSSPLDFHHISYQHQRMVDCDTISAWMSSQGMDISWWENVKSGKQYPWEKLKANDTNKQMVQFNMKVNQQGKILSYEKDSSSNVGRGVNV